MAQLDNATSRLLDVTETLQEQYWPTFQEQIFRKGQSTNRIIPFMEKGEFEVVSDGINVQVESGLSDTARGSTNPNSAFPRPRAFNADKIKVRFQEDGTSANDFWTLNTAAKVTHHELESGSDGAIINIAEKVFKDVTKDFNEKLAIHRNTARSGLLARVNGTPKQNNAVNFTDATSGSVTNLTGARFPIDSGSIGLFNAGMHIDLGTNATNVEITDVNTDPDDLSIGVKFNSASDDTSIGDLGNVVDDDPIYFDGGLNNGMYSLEEWFTRPTSGESWIGGRDRADQDSRWLLPVSVRDGATSTVQIQPSHFNDLGDAMNFVHDGEETGVVAYGATRLISSLRERLDGNSIVQLPPKPNGKRQFTFGAVGVQFQHPTFGMVTLLANTFAKPGTLRLMVPETWRSLYWGWRDLMFMPGDAKISPWYRPNDDAPNADARGKVYRLDGFAHFCDMCLQPRRQGQILNVSE